MNEYPSCWLLLSIRLIMAHGTIDVNLSNIVNNSLSKAYDDDDPDDTRVVVLLFYFIISSLLTLTCYNYHQTLYKYKEKKRRRTSRIA